MLSFYTSVLNPTLMKVLQLKEVLFVASKLNKAMKRLWEW